MIRVPNFWELELEAPLLVRELGHLQQNSEGVSKQVEQWPTLAKVTNADMAEVDRLIEKWTSQGPTNLTADTYRIIREDAKRTFAHTSHHEILVRVLEICAGALGDYGQPMSYMSGLLLLTLDERNTIALILKLCREERYIPGYWRHEATAAATDAVAFGHLIEERFPEIHEILKKGFVPAQAFCPKWFAGLNTQMLPFESLYPFLEEFLKTGYTHLYKTALSIVDHLKDRLIEAGPRLRSRAYNETIRPQMERARAYVAASKKKEKKAAKKKAAGSDEESDLENSDFSDEESDGISDNFTDSEEEEEASDKGAKKTTKTTDLEAEEGECRLCALEIAEYYCVTCETEMCEGCYEEEEDSHADGHKVVEYEAWKSQKEAQESGEVTDLIDRLKV
eukprot:Colp12_sorted_trinity150504_noHs@1821